MREDLQIKKYRLLFSTQKAELLYWKRAAKSLDLQYKRVINDYIKILKWYKNNAWKATFISLHNRLKEVFKK